MFELSKEKQEVLDAKGNLLVMGGPGSGKTTIALLKADCEIHNGTLKPGQKVLFLSFARATISRVEQHAKGMLKADDVKALEITTYHSFIWTILKSHGRLLVPQNIKLLPPHDASARLSMFENKTEQDVEKNRLLSEEGLLHFDLFAKTCADLLSRSTSISKILSEAYPIIIVDEFQDTNKEEWTLISHLGKRSTLIALADPDQRIYDFRGADPARIRQFIQSFQPMEFDFGTENNRSNGTDIVQFGNDLLAGRNKGKVYQNVKVVGYTPMKENAQLLKLKSYALKRLQKSEGNPDWSFVILTPTNRLMMTISECLGKPHRLKGGGIIPSVPHDVAVDVSGLSIAAVIIARLLELSSKKKCDFIVMLESLCDHMLGRNGDSGPSKADRELVQALSNYMHLGDYSKDIRGKTRQLLLSECKRIAEQCNAILLTGDVAADWLSVRNILSLGTTEPIKRLLGDSMLIKLLHKGSLLNSSLSQIWRDNADYTGAAEAVRTALTQEYFASSTKTWSGINVMTIHKAKGKEFDEVIVYEGAFEGRFVVGGDFDKAKLNLRVAVTRAKSNTHILTPSSNPCPLL